MTFSSIKSGTGMTFFAAALALIVGAGAVYGYQHYSKPQEPITSLQIVTPKGVMQIGVVSNPKQEQ